MSNTTISIFCPLPAILNPSDSNIVWFLPTCSTAKYILSIPVNVKKKCFGTYAYNRLLGDKSPFSQQNLQGDSLDGDEETSRIQCKSSYFCVFKFPMASSQPSILAFFVTRFVICADFSIYMYRRKKMFVLCYQGCAVWFVIVCHPKSTIFEWCSFLVLFCV